MSLIKSFQVHYVYLKKHIQKHGFDEQAQIKLTRLKSDLEQIKLMLNNAEEKHQRILTNLENKINAIEIAQTEKYFFDFTLGKFCLVENSK